jgi:hypothetical protein
VNEPVFDPLDGRTDNPIRPRTMTPNKSKAEMTAYINQLNRIFSDAESKGIDFKIKKFHHDFGTYGEVCMYWNTDNEVADQYVYIIESNLPATWDREALQELNLEPSKIESKDYGNWS